jgi:hypothetical protein
MMWAGLMRRCASRVAMWRVSRVDQPTWSGSSSTSSAAVFFGVADDSRGSGLSPAWQTRASPAGRGSAVVPGAGPITIKAKFVFVCPETILDGPAPSCSREWLKFEIPEKNHELSASVAYSTASISRTTYGPNCGHDGRFIEKGKALVGFRGGGSGGVALKPGL